MRPTLLLAAALTIVALCGCSHSNSGRATTLIFVGPGVEPDTLNPLLTQESDTADLAGLYMPVMLQFDARNRFVPEIATRIPSLANGGISRDGLTITYHLRGGVRWQDGAPLTASDAVFTYHAIMNPGNNVSTRAGYDQIANVTAPDRWTVILHMKRPFSPIVSQFENYPAFPILPAHILAKYRDLNRVPFNALPIGAGPYIVSEWARGDHITFQANPRYWRGRPRIQRLVFKFVPNANTAAGQLRTGEVGAWFNADPNAYPQLLKTRVRLLRSSLNDIHLLLLNLRDPILSDLRVRQAIAAALDRARIVKTVVRGLGSIVDVDQPPFSWAYTKPSNEIAYDPVRAARLLDAAGWRTGRDGVRYKGGQPLAVSFSGTVDVTAWQQVAVMVQDQLRRAGFLVSIKTFPTGLYFDAPSAGGILLSGKYQLAYDARLLGADPNDESYYGCGEFPPRGQNDVFWCNPIADAALHDALISYDQARRKKDYAIMQEQMARDVPIIPLWDVTRVDAFSVDVKNFSPSPAGPTFWNVWRWFLGTPLH